MSLIPVAFFICFSCKTINNCYKYINGAKLLHLSWGLLLLCFYITLLLRLRRR